jgi:putative oxidoreductase
LNDTSRLGSIALLAARFLMAAIFMFAGYGKLAAYHETEVYMQNAGLPDFLLPLVILTELGGGLALILGWQVRIAALLLGGFSILTGLLFHTNFSDANQTLNFLKNIAMAGGFLALFVSGAGAYSLDMPRRWTEPPPWPPGRRSRTSLMD